MGFGLPVFSRQRKGCFSISVTALSTTYHNGVPPLSMNSVGIRMSISESASSNSLARDLTREANATGTRIICH